MNPTVRAPILGRMVHVLRLLTLVRHGETDWNRTGRYQGLSDAELNETGRSQARCLADRFRGADVAAVYSSPLVRAWDTAVEIASAVGQAPRPVRDLHERDVGRWGGLTPDEIRARWPDEWERAHGGVDVALGGGETAAQVGERIHAAVDALASAHAGGHVVVVSHGFALRILVCRLLGLDLRHADRLATGGNASVTEFEVRRGVPRLLVYGDTSHLRP